MIKLSITDPDKIDAAAAGEDELVLLISDHLGWDSYQAAHLSMLQDKLNTYIKYIDSKSYMKQFPGNTFTKFRIQIDFLHKYDGGFVKMLNLAKTELNKRNITVTYSVV